ncbi:unnamed protein product [Rhodiola kirilowii]
MESFNGATLCSDRLKELRSFDDTKSGVQGLVHTGLVTIPKIFVRPPDELAEEANCQRSSSQLPVVDLRGLHDPEDRKLVVDEIRKASEEWGFFHLVNHGCPSSILNNMLEGIRKFHEQNIDEKKMYYSREATKKVMFNSNYDLFLSRAANWRDSLSVSMITSPHVDPNDLPLVCRDATMEYIKHIMILVDTILELLSEALGLNPGHLKSMECDKGTTFMGHYYPACPQPQLTLGLTKHTDNTFITILLQVQTSGLQVLHNDYWIDVQPFQDALTVNIGDLLQIVSNDKFKSNVHRVLANTVPRVSVVSFFAGRVAPPARVYAPITELTSEENPPRYGEVLVSDYVSKFYVKGLHEKPSLNDYKIL